MSQLPTQGSGSGTDTDSGENWELRLYVTGQILAVPTVVRRLPAPFRKIVGDLSDTDRLLVGLQIRVPGKVPT